MGGSQPVWRQLASTRIDGHRITDYRRVAMVTYGRSSGIG